MSTRGRVRRRTVYPAIVLTAIGGAGLTAVDEAVRVTNAIGPALLVVSGYDSVAGECRRNEISRGSGTIKLDMQLESPQDCQSSVAVFGKGVASRRVLDPGWTHDEQSPLDLTLEPRFAVALNVVVPHGVTKWARADISRASSIFNTNKAGLVFKPSSVRRYTAAEPQVVGQGCGDAAAVRSAGPPLYREAEINVYYIDVEEPSDVTWMGFNCFEEGLPNVIYISTDAPSITTLAHELGHALNLRGASGHTDPSAGIPGMETFTDRNLMYSAADMETSTERNALSLGQIFRMNWDGSSLVNAGVAGRASLQCQADAVASAPCPRLSLDPEHP